MSDLAIFLAFVALLLVVAVVLGLRQRAKWRALDEAAKQPPKYWVGVTVYEGESETAAAAAYAELQNQQHTLPGDREWMNGATHVRTFKVV